MKKTVTAPGQPKLALVEGKTESLLRAEEAERQAAIERKAKWALLDASYTRSAWDPAYNVHLDESVRLHSDDFAACVAAYRSMSLDLKHGASAIGTALRTRAKIIGVALSPAFLAALSDLNQRRHAAREQGRSIAGAALAVFSPNGEAGGSVESVETEWISSAVAGLLLGGMSGWEVGRTAAQLGVERMKLKNGGYLYRRVAVLAARDRMARTEEAPAPPVVEPAIPTAADPTVAMAPVTSTAPRPTHEPAQSSAVQRLAGMLRSGGISLDEALQLLEASRAPNA